MKTSTINKDTFLILSFLLSSTFYITPRLSWNSCAGHHCLAASTYIYIYIYIYISSCRAASTDIPDRLSPLVQGLQGYIPYSHIAAVCMFEQVVLLLLGHMWAVNRSTSLMSSSLLLQQCPACLVRLAWIDFVMGGRCPYSWCLVGYCRQDLFNIARNILV